ncbi:MAG: site-specific integrase [Cyanobacteria bacterium REEB67]|nr:site-specific integrase [Cyanobacteria bacterium REEB67]
MNNVYRFPASTNMIAVKAIKQMSKKSKGRPAKRLLEQFADIDRDKNTFLCPPDQEKVWIHSYAHPGLYLEVRNSQKRSWFGYLLSGSQQARLKLGDGHHMTYLEAQIAFNAWAASLGIDPKSTYGQAPTVASFFHRYFQEHLSMESSRPTDYKNAFNRYWRAISNIKIENLTTLVIKEWQHQIATQFGKETANKQLTILKACYKYCFNPMAFKRLPDPFAGVKKYKSKPEQRHLKEGAEDELFKHVLSVNENRKARAIEMLYLTGQRKSNVLSMKWRDIDLDNQTWTISAKEHKTGNTVCIALSDKALNLLRSLTNDSDYVFPSEASKSGHIANIDYFWRQIREEAGIEHLHLHDLRHTVGTRLGQAGTSGFVIQKALGHSNVRTTERYTHIYGSTVRDAMNSIQSNH